MGAPTTNPNLLFAAAGIALAIVGAVLLWWGHWPRRTGDQPHCRGCGYLLLGNRSGRCPECGRDLSDERSIVRGVRTRRKGVAGVGVALLLFALLFIGAAASNRVREIDWYRYHPAAWVVKDAGSDNPARALRAWQELALRRVKGTLSADAEAGLLVVALRDVGSADPIRAERAWAELMRRRDAETLDSAAKARLIEAALAEQAKPKETSGPLRRKLIDHLASEYIANRLSAPQADRFLSQALRLDLQVRPLVARGDPVPYVVAYIGDDPTQPGSTDQPIWWHATKHLGVWCDGESTGQGGGGGGSGMGFGGGSSIGSSVNVRTPGKHVLEVGEHVEIYYGKMGDPPGSRLCSSRDVSLKREFELLAEAPPGYVKLLDRPELLRTMQSCIRVQEFGFPYRDGEFRVQFEVQAPPENIAFQAFARAGGTEYELGTFAANKGKTSGYGILSGYGPEADKLKDVQFDRMDVILRSSEKVARGTVDQFQIWQGEIVIPDVKVQRPAPVKRPDAAPTAP